MDSLRGYHPESPQLGSNPTKSENHTTDRCRRKIPENIPLIRLIRLKDVKGQISIQR